MTGEHDDSPLIAKLAQHSRHPVCRLLVNPGERFVGEHDIRVRRQCSREGHATQRARRKAAASDVGDGDNPESVEQGQHRVAIRTGQPSRQRQVFGCREVGVEVSRMSDEGQAWTIARFAP